MLVGAINANGTDVSAATFVFCTFEEHRNDLARLLLRTGKPVRNNKQADNMTHFVTQTSPGGFGAASAIPDTVSRQSGSMMCRMWLYSQHWLLYRGRSSLESSTGTT